MAATFQWGESNGAGETQTLDRAEANWKNVDDSTTAYSSSPITAGNNSFEKWLFGKFSGTFNQISAGLWAHTAGALGTGLAVKGQPAMTVDADRLAYATPATTANASLTFTDRFRSPHRPAAGSLRAQDGRRTRDRSRTWSGHPRSGRASRACSRERSPALKHPTRVTQTQRLLPA